MVTGLLAGLARASKSICSSMPPPLAGKRKLHTHPTRQDQSAEGLTLYLCKKGYCYLQEPSECQHYHSYHKQSAIEQASNVYNSSYPQRKKANSVD